MLARVVGPLVLACSVAEAAPPELMLGHQQLALEPRRNLLTEDPLEEHVPWARYAAFAQLTGGGRMGGDAGVGASGAMSGLGCDLLAGTAQGRLRPFADGGAPLGEVTYAACPIAFVFTIALDGRRALGIMPALDARRSLWNRSYVAVSDRVTIGFGPYANSEGAGHTIALVSVGHGTTTQQDDSETRTTKQLDVELTLYRLAQPLGLQLDVVSFNSHALKAGVDNKGGVASEFMPVRVRYQLPTAFVAASAGWGLTGGQLRASSSTEVNGTTVNSWSDRIDGSGLPELSIFAGKLEAGVQRDRITATGLVSRTVFPTFDGNIAREARVGGNVTYVAGAARRTTLSLSPFATRTRTWTRTAGSARDHAIGASLHVGHELPKQLQLADRTTKLRVDAIGEAGVSPYAAGNDARLAANELGGQVMVALSGRVARHRR